MSRAKVVDHYIQKVTEGGLEIDQVRKELVANNVDEHEIRIIVRLVDREVQRRMYTTTTNSKANGLVGVGLVLTIVGGGITALTYPGAINMVVHF
ncbi:MAG TPA: hypothetical protein VFE50_11665 [Cyclobacteriaceae bacterium]|nr:hypothetical protein [Cyclobacteriaceae bacterium]